MKIATWNCNRALNRKLPLIAELNVDLCVVPEAERVIRSLHPREDYLWFGFNDKKGLGIYARDLSLERASVSRENWIHFLPLSVDGGRLRLLAVWAFNHRVDRFGEGAIGEPLQVLDELGPWLTEKPTFIVGDFNNAVRWDKPGKRSNFRRLHEWLGATGFRSAYHEHFKEPLGAESRPTHYHRKSLSSPYHIDYVYTNKPSAIKSLYVGTPSEWLRHSDHVPIVMDLEDGF